MLLPLVLAPLLSGGAGSVAAQSWRPLDSDAGAGAWRSAPEPSPYLRGFAADAPQDGLGGGGSSETAPQSSGVARFAPEAPEGQGWRFREDPAFAAPAQAPASADAFRFRPLSEGERMRREVDSGWRPLEPERERGGAPPGAWPRAPWEAPR
ncbi:MAG: hypothetical protein JXM75_12000 [Chromatiaceae bacterium]|nr:hypothetical protein [Chromatiaceae bacterium]